MVVTNARKPLVSRPVARLAAAFAALSFACAAVAQNAPGPPLGVAPATAPQLQTPTAQPLQPANPPGLFGTIGRWVDQSIGNVTAGLNTAREAVGDLGGQASEAAK